MGSTLTTKQFIQKSKEIHGDKYDYSETEYKGTHKEVKIICPKHGEFWQMAKKHTSKKRGCPECGVEKSSKSQFTKEKFIERAQKVHGDFYDYSQLERDNEGKVKIICPEHGEFWQLPVVHYQGHGCAECGKTSGGEKRKVTYEEFIKQSKEKHGDFYDYSQVSFNNVNEKIKIICPKHGEFWQKAVNHYFIGYGCNKCAIENKSSNNPMPKEKFIEKAKAIHGDKYNYNNTQYIKSHEYLKVECPKHGEWNTLAYIHLQGRGCPKCRISKGQEEVVNFIESLGLKTKSNDRKQTPPYEIDIYIPEKNIGIEYHGLYWHSEQKLKETNRNPKKYHLHKLEKAEENDIRLIQIFEHEWENKKEIVKHRLRHILGLSEKIGARKTNVSEISSKQGRDFLNKYHIQGAGKAKCYFGLFHLGELVSVMSFSSLRIALGSNSKEGVFELSRFASSCQVIGGASKLLCYFIEKYNPVEIVSYSDRRWNTGNVYESLGFSFVHNTEPNYWYLTEDDVVHRYGYRKSLLEGKLSFFDASLSEYENMLINGYDRIWDCGNRKFSFSLS